MQTKRPISEMTNEEIQIELDRLQSTQIPSDRRAAAPPRKRDVKPRTRKASWRDQLFGDEA
jgi:hypothetical protein